MKPRRLLTLTAALCLAIATATVANAAFDKKSEYVGFSDVKDTSWYYESVKNAYEKGLVTGTTQSTFSPSSTLTVAEGITLASRVHAEYNGKTIGENKGENWYDVYVKYAVDNAIVYDNQFDDYTREIKRYEMAEIFHDAMGEQYFEKINDVVFVPDVPIGAVYYDKLLNLYNAGVVMGNDEYGCFCPNDSIKRCETAAIVERVVNKGARLKKELSDFATKDAYTLCYNVGMNGNKEGINSGWILDNRGGVAKTDLAVSNMIGDVSEKYGTAFIREFNFIPSGKIILETTFTAQFDGSYVEYRDIKENSTYMLKIVDGKWCILQDDGKYKEVCEISEDGHVNLRAEINLDTGKSKTIINGGAFVVGELLSDNIMSYKIGIDEKGRGSVSVSTVNMVVNYGMYENFDIFGIDEAYGWENAKGVTHKSGQLDFVSNSTLTKRFDAVDGKVCFETSFIRKTDKDFDIKIGDNVIVSSKDKQLYVNDTLLRDLPQNMWHRLRVEIDNPNKLITVYLNGRVAGTSPLNTASPVNYVAFSTDGYLSIDNTRLYALYEYDDYVPKPTQKASMDDYIVGMNICSLWRNGIHSGWACVSAYEEPTPVLGYYDEGLAETADWEIKYMTEHGVDFQAFCWYNDVSSGPVKEPRNAQQLHDGYMYAKYSDYMKYCILFEAANCAHFTSDQFRNYIVPYWFENYFLDPRYMTIDNQLLLPVFGAWKLKDSDYFGSVTGVRKELDYLDEKAREYGFDGVLVLYNGTASSDYEKMGFDGVYAYNWSHEGNDWRKNIEKNTTSANVGSPYAIPTVSVGFDSIPWHGERYGNMPATDLGKALNWVIDKYLPKYSDKDSWQDRLIWLSTWNEYGEGTYMMPSGLNGFGYLDEVREHTTNFGDEHEDIVPTPKQKQRINHLYPQYATLLRRDGWYFYERDEKIAISEPTNKLFVNDVDILENCEAKYRIPPMIKDGKVYFPFNPSTGLAHILGSLVSYRREAGTLKIEANNHTVIYQIGKDRYTVDGVEKNLGYTLETFDNLPMLDFVQLAKDLGYRCSEKDGNVYIYTDTYDTVWQVRANLKAGAWEFNNDFNDEGWTSTNMTLATTGGTITMTSMGETNDPITRYKDGIFPEDFYTKKYKGIEIRCRYSYSGNRGLTAFYYTTDLDSQWNEAKCLRITHQTNDTKGEWVILTYDLTAETNWIMAERLTGLRFDPFNATGSMEIDYIRFIEDEDYVYIDPDDRQIEIANGDAENSALLHFYSANATISRVEDAENEGNHYWYVKTNLGPNYTYFRCAARYKPYTKYKIEYDIKLMESNSGNSSEDITETIFYTNFRYADKGAFNDFDHVVRDASVTNISQNDGWVHYTATYITGKIDEHSGSEFTVYANPNNNVAFSFALDNIVVTEITE